MFSTFALFTCKIQPRWAEEGKDARHLVNMRQEQKAVVDWCKSSTQDFVKIYLRNEKLGGQEEEERSEQNEGKAMDQKLPSDEENDAIDGDNEEQVGLDAETEGFEKSDENSELLEHGSNPSSSQTSGQNPEVEEEQKKEEDAKVKEDFGDNGPDEHDASSTDDADIILEKVVRKEERHVVTLTDDEAEDRDVREDAHIEFPNPST